MNFVEVGRYKINVDLILWLNRQNAESVHVYLSGAPEPLVLQDEDAKALWCHIKAEAPEAPGKAVSDYVKAFEKAEWAAEGEPPLYPR